MVDRNIKLPENASFFLFGPRQTGKSTLIQARFPKVWCINLLHEDTFLEYAKNPSLLRKQTVEKIAKQHIETVFIDEVQRIPNLLNEVQALMQSYPTCRFILTGSSARKLKRGQANLLAGRAFERHLFPFTYHELGQAFNLDEALQLGTLPPLLNRTREEKIEILSAYVRTYLQEEIKNEGIVRQLGSFSRFLDMAASQSGEILNFSNIARECHLAKSTVQSYYEILEDTLIGFRLEPWRKSIRKRLSAHPKFYLFDTGITNAINKRLSYLGDPALKGRLFEQWLILETFRYIHYQRSEARLFFWRTNHGAEVDLLIEKHGRLRGAFEIKASSNVAGYALSGLRAFREEHSDTPCQIVCTTTEPYKIEGVHVLPWQQYLEQLNTWID